MAELIQNKENRIAGGDMHQHIFQEVDNGMRKYKNEEHIPRRDEDHGQKSDGIDQRVDENRCDLLAFSECKLV